MLSKEIKKIADLLYHAPAKEDYTKDLTKTDVGKYFDESKWMKYLVKGKEQYFSDIPEGSTHIDLDFKFPYTVEAMKDLLDLRSLEESDMPNEDDFKELEREISREYESYGGPGQRYSHGNCRVKLNATSGVIKDLDVFVRLESGLDI